MQGDAQTLRSAPVAGLANISALSLVEEIVSDACPPLAPSDEAAQPLDASFLCSLQQPAHKAAVAVNAPFAFLHIVHCSGWL
jgi:hypothetical protein